MGCESYLKIPKIFQNTKIPPKKTLFKMIAKRKNLIKKEKHHENRTNFRNDTKWTYNEQWFEYKSEPGCCGNLQDKTV